MTCDVASWNDELYKCDAHVTISEDMNLVNGEVIPFTITGVKDIAGNETVVTEKDTTVSDKYGKVVYDNDPAQSIWVYILNDDEDHRTIIGDNQKLIVEINVDEELLVNPVITIGKYQVELTRRANDSRYIYSKTITIDADEMNLVHDENIAFTISVTDVAGKTTTLDNDNVTIHEENGYNQVKYDGKAPKYKQLGVLNVDHLRNDEDVTVAKTGDEIRVLFHFDEILDVNPKMTIGEAKTVYELKLVTDYENFAEYTYMADITLTKDMNLSDGALVYTIYGYADAAGNVGKTIKSTDEIKTYTKFPGVRIDNSNPEITVDKLNDNGYTNNGNVNIADASEFDVVVKIDGEVRHEYSNTKRADLSWLGDGEYEIIVTDAAGNSNTIKFNLDTVAAKKHAVYLWANTESVVENIDSKDYVVYYVTNGDVVTATISVNEILGENPKFVIGYNGGSYEVPQDQVIFRELDDVEDFKYVYSAQITIPEDVKTENTELTLTVYNVVDKAGNVTNNGEAIGISNVNRIFVDTTAPEITLYKWFDDGNHQVVEPGVHNYCVLADATDANLAGMTLDGKAYTNEELICDNGTYEIVATDKAGNESEITFTIDREYATLSVNGDNYNTYNDKNINYYQVVNELTITGAEDGIVRLYKDDEKLIDENYSDAVIEEIKAYLAEDGKYRFHIIDNAGNNTYALITVDDTVPTISKEYWNEDPIAFGSNFVEPSVSELISYSDNITEKENLIINEWYTFKALNSSSYVEADGIDTSAMGQYYHYFTVTDEAGNTSQRVSIGYYVTDLTAPKIEGVVDNGIYIATTSDYGWITGGILLKISDDTQYFDITFDGNHFLGVENENDANMFRNGFAYHNALNGVDICATDKFGNESCVKNVTIIRDENIDFKSILENGGNIILPENTTINLNGTVEIPEGTTITGNSSSIINGKLSINAANVTLKNVNVKDGGSAVIVGPNATNLVIDGGNFETTGLEYGQGTVRLDFTGGPAYTNNVTIKNANINGALHILNYNGSLDGIYGNIINVTTIPNNPLIGLLVTTDDNTNYTEEDFNKLNENNTILKKILIS